MKIKDRLIVLITIVFMMSSNVFASPVKENEKEHIFDLCSLGIIQGDESGNLNLDKPLTRAEFCAIVVRLQDAQAIIASAPDCGFTDVNDLHWAKKYIDYLTFNGIVNGIGNGLFEPEGYLSWQSASKILVNILGYGNLAISQGGYPTGYAAQAGKIGLLDDVELSDEILTRDQAFMMIYNALDIDHMVKLIGDESTYEIQSGNTFRNMLLSSYESEKRTGVVTATIDTWLEEPIPGMEDTEICIDGNIYKISDTGMKKYIGQEVDFYVTGKNEKSLEIISMESTQNNTVIELSCEKFDVADSDKIYWYENEGDSKRESLKWDINTVVIKNNEPLDIYNADTFNSQKSGEMILIDNDDDKCIDVVIIKEPTNVIVDEVLYESGKIIFKDGYSLFGKNYFEKEPLNDEAYITLSDSDGNAVEFENIKSGDVISGFDNFALHRYELIIGKESVAGKITEVSDDYVCIDDIRYFASEKILASENCVSGKYVRAYINYNDEVVFIEEELSEVNYGYITSVIQKNNFSKPLARVLIPGTLEERVEEEENEAGGESTKINKIFGRNRELLELELSSQIKVDGVKIDDGIENIKNAIEGKVVRFSLNSSNEIHKIDFPKEVDTDSACDGSIKVNGDKTYNSYEMTFGKTVGGAFGVTENTYVICVPKGNAAPSTDDYLVGVEMKNEREYTVKAFDKNENTKTADLIVIQADMNSGSSGIINTSSKIGFVSDISLTLNDDGDEVNKITLLSEGEIITLYVSNLLDNTDEFKKIKKGELIKYSVDLEGRLDAYSSLTQGKKLTKSTQSGIFGGYTDNETVCGYVCDIEYSTVSNNLNRWVHNLYLSDSENGNIIRELSVYKFSGPDIIIYDSKNDCAVFGDIKEINLNSDKVFVSVANSIVKAIVVIR